MPDACLGEYYTALESFHGLNAQYANNASLIGYVERGRQSLRDPPAASTDAGR